MFSWHFVRPLVIENKCLEENKIQNIDLLKIDVEGAEIDILMSIDKMLMDKISQISVEFQEKQFDTEKYIG